MHLINFNGGGLFYGVTGMLLKSFGRDIYYIVQ